MINLLLIINKPIERANDLAGYIGRNLSIFAMGLMVVVILTQVYFRYVLNNALPSVSYTHLTLPTTPYV